MTTTAAEDIRQGLNEALAYAKGDTTKGREFTVEIPDKIDIRAIRKRLKLSQQKFASTFGFDVANIRNWEQGRRIPPRHARAYLCVIGKEPETVSQTLASATK